jgi:hypothetical protein
MRYARDDSQGGSARLGEGVCDTPLHSDIYDAYCVGAYALISTILIASGRIAYARCVCDTCRDLHRRSSQRAGFASI